jgi:NTE family protein
MLAYVFSGGNVRGALQVGAAQALLADPARRPDFIVGTSIGAINGAHLAANPTLQGALHLAEIWRNIRREDAYPGHRLKTLWRLIRRKDSLYPHEPLRAMFTRTVTEAKTFGDLKIPLYITANSLNSTALYYWGDDPAASIIEALLTTTAVPFVFPPMRFGGGYEYVDGGLIANLPLEIAIERGATEIYALDVSYLNETLPSVSGAITLMQRSIQIMLHQQAVQHLRYATALPGLTVHHLRLDGFKTVAINDFTQSDAMIDAGRRMAEEYLANPQPNFIFDQPAPPPPPGAVQFIAKRNS